MSLQAPVVASKTLGPSQELEFMGIVLDSIRMEARLPDDKLNRAREILNSFTQRRSVRLFELQSLIGTPQFACKPVVPGRTFLQRMINLTKGVPSRFHHIRLNKEFFKDLKMWKTLLADWNGRSFFLNTTVTPSPQMELYTDASGTIGYGGYFNWKWFQVRWLPHMQLSRVTGISIGERDFTMIGAAFTLAFFAFLRCSEFTCRGTSSYSPSFDLSVSSTSFEPNLACPQRMSVFLQSSKTDAFRRGHTLVIACSSLFLTCASPGSLFFHFIHQENRLFPFSGTRLVRPVYPIVLLRGIVFVSVLSLLLLLQAYQIG